MKQGVQGFQAVRLQQLRMNANLTQSELAVHLQCAEANISKWENGKSIPSAFSFQRISSFFGVPESWLLEPMCVDNDRPCFFRAKNSSTKASREIAGIRLEWLEEIFYKLHNVLAFPDIKIPEFKGDFRLLSSWDIERLAGECRQLWRLGSGPIPNLVQRMEANGVIVASGSLGFLKMDGVSRWSCSEDPRPFVFLCSDKSNGFRSRFDAGHELGHIVLHGGVTEDEYKKFYDLLESQAHRFASALLLPADSFLKDVRYPTLDNLLAIKAKWGVSVAAMIQIGRAHV